MKKDFPFKMIFLLNLLINICFFFLLIHKRLINGISSQPVCSMKNCSPIESFDQTAQSHARFYVSCSISGVTHIV